MADFLERQYLPDNHEENYLLCFYDQSLYTAIYMYPMIHIHLLQGYVILFSRKELNDLAYS